MPEITVFTKASCPQCSMTVRKLDEMGVTYNTIRLDQNEAALEWALEAGFKAAPIVAVGDIATEDYDAWTGFRPDKLGRLSGGQ